MWRLLTVSATLAAFFASTFLVITLTGLVTIEDIKHVLVAASEVNVLYVGIAVMCLLFMDMFIAVPTLTIVTLSGYFMGPLFGAMFSVLGMWAAGLSGYFICRQWGDRLLLIIYKDQKNLDEMRSIFKHYGVSVLVLCRATPILPEVTCCLSGANKIAFSKFFTFYSLGTVPYAMLAAFAGSKSSLEDPLPGIFGATSMSVVLWVCWYVLIRRHHKAKLLTGQLGADEK